ncbi:MAG: tetratricopeptide repeat protein [Cyanobacteriota bacterium]|nr:tetratricopeptide repeat protein [Cyanobacteriota bacterium]
MNINDRQTSGNQFMEEGDFEKAIQEYQKALEVNPNYIPALSKLAEIYEIQKEFSRSLEYNQKIATLRPDRISAYMKLAKTMTNQGRLEEASHIYSQVLKKFPGNLDDVMKSRFARINFLATLNKSVSYLEIGVCKGVTFTQIALPNKVAVDPKFQFNYSDYKSEKVEFHEITSDDFFKLDTDDLFDFIYLDGLHIFEQTFRDFCSTLSMAHGKTIWLIDDTVPSDRFAAERSQKECGKLRRAAGHEGSEWMGDVFKIVYAIHDFFPQFSYATFPHHGQTVVWRETRKCFKPHLNSLSAISNLTFQDFLNTKEAIMNFQKPTEIIALLNDRFKNFI